MKKLIIKTEMDETLCKLIMQEAQVNTYEELRAWVKGAIMSAASEYNGPEFEGHITYSFEVVDEV